MRWMTGLTAVMMLAAIGVAPAAAIDVQGTWEGTLKCKFFPPDELPAQEAAPVSVLIAQSDDDITIGVSGLGMTLIGLATDKGVVDPAKKGVIGAGTCDTGGIVLGGIFGKVKVDPDGTGSLDVTLTGVSIAGPIKCTIKATRTDAANPSLSG